MTATLERSGHFAGFPEGTSVPGDKPKPVNFEPSSIAKGSDAYYVVSDKPIPGHSSLVRIDGKAFLQIQSDPSLATAIDSKLLQASSKIEGLVFGNDYSFATTDFEWITKTAAEADSYNNLVVWPTDNILGAALIHESVREGIASSRDLRESFATALRSAGYPDGPPYYKVEGLELLGKQLWFGVREIGTDYQHPEPCFVVLATDVVESPAGPLTISKSFQTVLAHQVVVPGLPTLKFGLTSLSRQGSLFIASAVSEQQLSNDKSEFRSALFWFTYVDGECSAPQIVNCADSKPLLLNSKVEGVCFASDKELVLVCDDDRELVPLPNGAVRKPHEAAYFVVTLEIR